MSDATAIKKQLKIKSGSTKRLLKEATMYRNEATQLQLKRDKFVADGAENWDIGNATRMLEESNKMIVDTTHRLGAAVQDLRDLIVSARKIDELVGSAELQAADDVLEEASV